MPANAALFRERVVLESGLAIRFLGNPESELHMQTASTLAGLSVAPPSVLRTRTTTCALCGEATPERVVASRMIATLHENLHFGGELAVVQCRRCGLRYLNPAPDLRDLPHIYQYEVWADSTNANPVLMEHFYEQMRRHVPHLSRVFEVGCGTGDFLAWLESKGLQCDGNEFAESATHPRFKGQMFYGRMEDVEVTQKYDAVLLLNVIEHLADPRVVLQKLRSMLAPNGVLIVRHPNAALFYFPPYRYTVEAAKYLYHRWQLAHGTRTRYTICGFQNQHLFYFDRRTTTRLLKETGFEVVSYSTSDPYNRLRFRRGLRQRRSVDVAIAGVRQLMGKFGLGTECLFVARASEPAAGGAASR